MAKEYIKFFKKAVTACCGDDFFFFFRVFPFLVSALLGVDERQNLFYVMQKIF